MAQSSTKSLFWLASYPKSGNTWLRIVLANYLLGGDAPLAINAVRKLGYSDSEAAHYTRANGGPYDLADAQKTIALREKSLLNIVTTGPKVALIKTHNYNSTINNVALIPSAYTRGAIYVARHPGDVALSFASHYGLSIDETIARMAEPRAVVGGSKGAALQFTSDWSSHVQSWAASKAFKVSVIRYEDMHDAPKKVFGSVLKHMGVAVDADKLDRAIAHSKFDELQKQEQTEAFSENTAHQPQFFRSGTAGGWRDNLSKAQIDALTKTHGKIMKALGYL
ncbi:hypothetical protein FHS72_002558 [Loktanella ponticola]|uniref:Sulfotransferase domain-containing protein n=1 Tax=Yoonia ponticola TaxID=1524255 RepID=A0A7W9BLU9_9RHOB|nr:sulfotransferase domain-containing protein [Yoonia ponticola]MBB5722922.1 hypothetical protein [Yoonia ponticola]